MNGDGGRCSQRTCGRLWKGRQRRKTKEKRAERARDINANPSYYSPCRASTTRVPPLVCSPQLTGKGGPTSLGRGEGLAATAPSRREREKTKGEAAVVVGDKRIILCQHNLSATFHRWWMTSYRHDYFRDAEIEINDVDAC